MDDFKAEKSTQQQLDIIKINENASRNLEHEIQGYKTENQKLMKQIMYLEQEREKCGTEASEATRKYNEVHQRLPSCETNLALFHSLGARRSEDQRDQDSRSAKEAVRRGDKTEAAAKHV